MSFSLRTRHRWGDWHYVYVRNKDGNRRRLGGVRRRVCINCKKVVFAPVYRIENRKVSEKAKARARINLAIAEARSL